MLSREQYTLPENINDTVDVAVFAGQSNMSGRGTASDATVCDVNAGFEYKSVSNPTTLVPIQEPFSLNEDRENGIYDYNSDGTTKRTGSMVSSVVDEYYEKYRQTTCGGIGVNRRYKYNSVEKRIYL